ncbi:SURF1 family protein [Rarobacter faecitabidus]|uniref:SURF1-like protein n=1 Tax=Rarobacter faecitabidus TaxID=13243 RepID=A0A542ZXE2_RARFA|nr:SURF1 family protein [Rarobacter faecitabidus]TQL65021.1 cytochrome oxidase assembly protein ShyY1 [Rarobacter faecitabidus]
MATGGEAGGRKRTFVEVALTGKMLGLLAVMLVVAVGCGLLGQWQLGRSFERARLASEQARLEREQGDATPIAQVIAPQSKFGGDLVGRAVTVKGTFEPQQYYVSGRALEGRAGVLALNILRVSDDGAGGASWQGLSGAPALAVVRGWSGSVDEASASPAPTGTVDLTVYLQGGEPGGSAPDANGIMSTISAAQLLHYTPGPIYSAYGVLAGSSPDAAGGLAQLPRPQLDGGSSVNLRNFFYAIEWWAFAGFAVALWIRMVRDDMRLGSSAVSLDDLMAASS